MVNAAPLSVSRTPLARTPGRPSRASLARARALLGLPGVRAQQGLVGKGQGPVLRLGLLPAPLPQAAAQLPVIGEAPPAHDQPQPGILQKLRLALHGLRQAV